MNHGMSAVLPFVMVILSGGAAGMYAVDADWRHCAYWLLAGALTFVVTTL
jgi:hypothetical protein